MTTLGPSTDYTGAAVTQGGKKTFIANMRAFIAEKLGTVTGAPIAVASSATLDLTDVAITSKQLKISGAAVIALINIAAGDVFDCVAAAGATFTIKDNADIATNNGGDIVVAAGASFTVRGTAANKAELLFYTPPVPTSGALLNTINFTAQTQALTSISNGAPAVLTCTSAKHLPETGSPIQLTTTSALPTGLALLTTYYVTNPAGSTFNVCPTYADALAGTNKIATSSAGAGTHTMRSVYVKNPSASSVVVEAWGAGGGSGGVSTGTGFGACSGGGGAGGYVRKKIASTALGATETVTIGAGGTAGTTAPTNGGNGGNTTFGAHVSASGGSGSGSVNTGNVSGTAGAGGVGSGGDLNLAGNAGSIGVVSTGTPQGYGGAGGFTTLGGVSVSNADARNNSGAGASGGGVANAGASAGAIGGSGRVIVYEYS